MTDNLATLQERPGLNEPEAPGREVRYLTSS